MSIKRYVGFLSSGLRVIFAIVPNDRKESFAGESVAEVDEGISD